MSFFAHMCGELPPYEPPNRVYAWVDATSVDIGDGLTRLDCVDAEWADEIGLRPGLLAEAELSEEIERRVSMIILSETTSEEQESEVLELRLGGQVPREESNAVHYLNLTGPGLPRRADINWPERAEAARIARITEPGGEDASEGEIVDVLQRAAGERVDAVAVYDVGQGSCAALIADDFPRLYVDMGGGATNNSHTFPTGFRGICTNAKQPVILSHWHVDHWSMAKRFSGGILRSTWIVPRQANFRPTSATLLGMIRRHGRALMRTPSGTSLRAGAVSLHDCMGNNINDSGLAAVAWGPDEEAIVLPGDARYGLIADLPPRVHSLVVAHHGGLTRATVGEIPVPDEGAGGRLVYSCGDDNSYHHPLAKSAEDHEAVWGWIPEIRTSDRPKGSAARHVHLYFDEAIEEVGLACAGKECSLSPSRR